MSLTTNDIEDIKQIIVANNATLMAEFDERLDAKLEVKLEAKLVPIRQQISDLTDFVTESMDTVNELHGKLLSDHEQRISTLEQRVA